MTRTVAYILALVAVVAAALVTGVSAFAAADTRTVELPMARPSWSRSRRGPVPRTSACPAPRCDRFPAPGPRSRR